MTPKRIAVKFEVKPDPEAPVNLDPVIGLFHRFIQQKKIEGLLIDVADYAHVPKGPGVMLIGHAVDYGIDSTGGRTGLLTVRKRIESEGIGDVLAETLRWSVGAMKAIEEDGSTGLEFATDRVIVQFIDRLVAPNSDEGFAAYQAELETLANRLYGKSLQAVNRIDASEERRPLSAAIIASKAADFDTLLARLGD